MKDFRAIARCLLFWYDRHGRRLPWRRTRDPYRILLSEVMLQQTQVERVRIFYRQWLRRFPTFKSLASANNTQVLRQWSGLGYNRRALQLRDAARHIVATGLPQDRDEWQGLKGVGPYTAAAVAVFSGRQPVLPIDTNIRRVLGRVMLGQPFPALSVDERLRRAVEPQLPGIKRFYDVPQALFDLANTVCRKVPDCRHCPLRESCGAAPKFLTQTMRIPRAMIKKAVERRHTSKPYPDRIYRGRILKIVHSRARVRIDALGKEIDPSFEADADTAWLLAIIARLAKDGFIQRQGKWLKPQH